MDNRLQIEKVMVSVVRVRNERFSLVKFTNGKYGMVNYKYLSNSGCTLKELNGFQVFLRETPEESINDARNTTECDYLMAQGMTQGEALAMVFGLDTETAKKIDELNNAQAGK